MQAFCFDLSIAMTVTATLVSAFAPTGRLRAAINVGNPILARLQADGTPAGVSIDLAQRLAARLGLPLELQVFEAAAKSVDAVTQEQADFGFFAVDPVRGAGIAFSAPYVLIEGAYMVRSDSPLTDNAQVDVAGHTVVVGQGSAYDLYLSRELQHASIVRAPTSPAVVDVFLAPTGDVAAGVKTQLEASVAQRSAEAAEARLADKDRRVLGAVRLGAALGSRLRMMASAIWPLFKVRPFWSFSSMAST